MSTYRMPERRVPTISTVETEGLVEILRRTRALRNRVALPTLVISAAVATLGAIAHVCAFWSVLGRATDGSSLLSRSTILIAALLPASPILLVGGALYVLKRRTMRNAWIAEFRAIPAEGAWPEREAWLAETARRFD